MWGRLFSFCLFPFSFFLISYFLFFRFFLFSFFSRKTFGFALRLKGVFMYVQFTYVGGKKGCRDFKEKKKKKKKQAGQGEWRWLEKAKRRGPRGVIFCTKPDRGKKRSMHPYDKDLLTYRHTYGYIHPYPYIKLSWLVVCMYNTNIYT